MNQKLKDITIKNLAMLVGKCLKQSGLDVVLVGGACVSIYTHNEYESFDLDLISYEPKNKIIKALKEIGFQFNSNQTFTHKDCKYFIEFVTPPICVGN